MAVAKTLENFYDDWHKVVIEYSNYTVAQTNWCTERFGIHNLKWSAVMDLKNKKVLFKFKNKDDALMFLLKFGE